MTDDAPISLQARYDIQVQEHAILIQELARMTLGQDQIAKLQLDLANANARIADLQTSTSWKITRPLRAIARTIRSRRLPS